MANMPRNRAWLAMLFVAAAGAAGCASRLDIRSQIVAGGQAGYELRGDSLALLQLEVARLCPAGAEVLRQWQRYEVQPVPSGFVRRWTVDLVDGPRSDAQMQVVCRVG